MSSPERTNLKLPYAYVNPVKVHRIHNISKIVFYARLGAIASIFSLVATAMGGVPPTLDDADRRVLPAAFPGTPDLYSLPYPRLNLTEQSAGSNIEISSKYNTVSYDGSHILTAAALKAKYPQTMVLRYFVPSSYQSANEGDGSQRSFLSTGPASEGSAVFAGHWLYLAGSTLKTGVDSKALVLAVNDPSLFTAGQYVVIYNGKPGDFLHAEHAKIASINQAKGTLTLAARGYKSTPASHPAGAVVAQHEHNAGGGGTGEPLKPESWSYNFGSRCPFDANGKQITAVMAEWLAANLNLDRTGNPIGSFVYDGVLFDGERNYFYPDSRVVDMDNDLVADGGLDPSTGLNMHGQALGDFYARLRSLIGWSKILVGSNGSMRGYSYLNGTQCEGYPNSDTSYSSPPDCSLSDQKFASYSYHLHSYSHGPTYCEVLSKTPTLIYPHLEDGGKPPTSNSPFRYGFGMALLDDGSYGQKRTGVNDPWWDEYSVDVRPQSSTFGHAIRNDDSSTAQIAKVRAHTGWLGSPLGPRTRIIYPAVFDVSKTLLPNGGFESGQGGWTGQNVNLSVQTGANVFSGIYSLHSSPMITYNTKINAASVKSPPISSSTSATYTLCFTVKSSRTREFGVQFGSGTMQTIVSGTTWLSHTLTFEAEAGINTITFNLGRESCGMSFDKVYLFKGNADVLRRDFQNGTVFVNASSAPRTINPHGKFLRIKGTQDPINDGSSVGLELTIPAYDAAILVRAP